MDQTALALLHTFSAHASSRHLSAPAARHLYAFIGYVARQPQATHALMEEVAQVLLTSTRPSWDREDAWAIAHRIGDTVDVLRRDALDAGTVV